ncbi:MAG: hypothetical protein ACRD1T_08075 [Acidimicrobiia bacterium]
MKSMKRTPMGVRARSGRKVALALFLSVGLAAGAAALASPDAQELLTTQGLAGEGIGYISCNQGEERCFASSPYSLAISAVGSNQLKEEVSKLESDLVPRPAGLFGMFSLCDVHNSVCIHGPLWTVANTFDCWTVVPPAGAGGVGGGATLYAGKWFHDPIGQSVPRSWWIFKVVDRGLEGVDQVGMRKSPGIGAHTRNDDGACGARDLSTSPLISGDFSWLDRNSDDLNLTPSSSHSPSP